MEYVLEYGRFKLINNIFNDVAITAVWTFVGGGLLTLLILAVVSDIAGETVYDFIYKYRRKILIILICIFATISLFPAVQHLATYKASPKAYSLRAVQQDFIKGKCK